MKGSGEVVSGGGTSGEGQTEARDRVGVEAEVEQRL